MRLVLFLVVTVFSLSAWASEEIIRVPSQSSAAITVEKLEKAITDKGLSVFARIDHAAAAEKAGLALDPTTVVIFGSPKVGTLLMQCDQQIGLDLPLKMLVYTDKAGKTWLSYTATDSLAEQYHLEKCSKVLMNIKKAMAGLAAAAAE